MLTCSEQFFEVSTSPERAAAGLSWYSLEEWKNTTSATDCDIVNLGWGKTSGAEKPRKQSECCILRDSLHNYIGGGYDKELTGSVYNVPAYYGFHRVRSVYGTCGVMLPYIDDRGMVKRSPQLHWHGGHC